MKLKIDNETLVEEFFECTRLLGIVAPVKDYQFSWLINQALGFRFRINNSLEIQLRKKKEIISSLFTNTKCRAVAWYITCIIISTTENIFCPNLSTSIFCGW